LVGVRRVCRGGVHRCGASARHLDIGFFRRDLAVLRQALGDRYDLWSVGSGMLRPLTDTFPDLHEGSEQVWIREHAWSPWRLDLLATEDRDGQWVNKRETSFAAPLEEITWVADDGIRYLAPDLVLAIKAKLKRPKDDGDLDAALPLLDAPARDRCGRSWSASTPTTSG